MKKIHTYNVDYTYSCRYLVVWCTKYRRKVLVGDIEVRLKELIQDTHKETTTIIETTITPNQVRLIIESEPKQSIHSVIKSLKGKTSRTLRDEFKELTTKLPTLWTNSYFVKTIGVISEQDIEEYVENQKTSQRM